MEKFALLGDLHIGVKNDDEWIERKIFESLKWFTDDCKAKGIRTCIQAGDWFDVRKGLTQRTLQFVREEVVPMFQETFDETYVIVGNHDMHNKNTIVPNSCREALSQYEKFTIIEHPTVINVAGTTIDLIPWICNSNKDEVMKFIRESESDNCVGHFELTGFYYYKGLKSQGDEPCFLEKYKNVWSGHFHTISSGGNVQYLGTPYTITLGDANDPRGYWTYTAGKDKIDFAENPVTNHHRVYFDADTWKYKNSELVEMFSDKVVKLVVEKSQSETNKKVKLDQILDEFEQICHEFSYEHKEEIEYADIDGEIETVDAMSIIVEQVNALDESDEVKQRILKIFSGLLAEAMGA